MATLTALSWKSKFTCRDEQINQLIDIFHDISAGGTYTVTGNSATGKTSILRYLLSSLSFDPSSIPIPSSSVPSSSSSSSSSPAPTPSPSPSPAPAYPNFAYSFLDCTLHFSSRSLLEDAMQQIWNQVYTTPPTGRRFALFPDFISLLQEMNLSCPIYLVFDNAERLGNTQYFERSLVFNLTRISHWTKQKISTIFASRKPFLHYAKECYPEPRDILFSPYTSENAMSIITEHHKPASADKILFGALTRLVIDVCWRRCSDLRELIWATHRLYPVFEQPVVNNEIKRDSTQELYAKIKPHLTRVGTNIYRRDKDATKEEAGAIKKSIAIARMDLIELPLCTKYLLLSAYLASIIPAALDDFIFAASSKKTDVPRRAEDTNARLFTLQRMLQIFSKITKGKNLSTAPVNIRFEVASLVAQNFLTQHGSSDGAAKFQFHTHDSSFIHKVARSVSFDLANYVGLLER